MLLCHNTSINFIPKNFIRRPVPTNCNSFFAHVKIRGGSYKNPPKLLSRSNNLPDCDFNALHKYAIRDNNDHPTLLTPLPNGGHLIHGKITHDAVHKILQKDNTLLGPMGNNKIDSYYNGHIEYILDPEVSNAAIIKESKDLIENFSSKQWEKIQHEIIDGHKYRYQLEHNPQYKGPNSSSSIDMVKKDKYSNNNEEID